jgi:predicted O-methyltransferase YrrM
MIRRVVNRLSGKHLPDVPLTGAADSRWSVISTVYDQPGSFDPDLLDLALRAARRAAALRLTDIEDRCDPQNKVWVSTWPGEHYRFIAALAIELEPETVVEVGTFKGQGALSLASHPGSTVVTYDIVPWGEFDDTALRTTDFESQQIVQRIGDLGNDSYRAQELETLRAADLVFIDGPKDGSWEQSAVPRLLADLTDRRRLVVFDDVRLVEMVQVWRDLPYAKLDVTSLGHWSGTGLLWTA